MQSPQSIAELSGLVRSAQGRIIPVGAGTKGALAADPAAEPVSLTALRGMVEYDPGEFTFTALAGTPVAEAAAALAANAQYLPFDPPFAAAGATLGGTVASNANGPGRLRFGGIRDFLIGVRFIDGSGALLRGGGKVVKNAAGFDFPKLMTGSMGRLGILAELSFKVFPDAPARLTAEILCRDLPDALDRLSFAARQTWEVEALEITPPGRLHLRLMGDPAALGSRMDAVIRALDRPARILPPPEADACWADLRDFTWVQPGALLVKVPLTPRRIPALDARLGSALRRYSMAGNAACISWPHAPAELGKILTEQNLTAVVWRGPSGCPARLGAPPLPSAERLVKGALDPAGRFPDFP